MKVTNIKQQQKRTDRYAIYIDNKYNFSLGESALLSSGLRIGQELTEAELKQYKQTAAFDKHYDRLLNYVALRSRSEGELRDYLRRKQAEPELSEQLIDRLRTAGFIDDVAFARAWVNSRRLLKPISKRRLTQELRQKRIAADTIDEILAADTTDELAVVKDLVIKKRRQSRYQDDLKLMQYLSRQGFSYDLIKRAMKDED